MWSDIGVRSFCRSVLILMLGALSWSSARCEAPAKWALLVGIDAYKQAPAVISPLRGAVNDVRLMKQVLIGKFEFPPANVLVLENEKATRQAILDAFQKHLIEQVQPGDVAVFHFSGHGSQMQDVSGDEIDRLDETLVPHDARTPDVFDISDDELNGLLTELSKKTKNITVILDSCHSGTAARKGNAVREIPADERTPPPPSSFARSVRAGEGEGDFKLDSVDYVLISGSLAKEYSNETSFEGRRHGALTWYWAQALQELGGRATYRDLMDDVRARVTARFPSQHPQIEGAGQDLVVFGTEKLIPKPYVLVGPAGGLNVHVEAGKALGIFPGTTLEIYPPRTVDFAGTQPVAHAKLTDVEDFEAVAQITDGGPVQPQSRAILQTVTFGDNSIAVYVDVNQSAALGPVQKALAQMPAVKLVDDETGARLVIRQDQAAITVRSGDLELLVPPVSIADANAAGRVVEQVEDIVHWMMVLELRNPTSTIRVGFDIRRADDPPGTPAPREVASGTVLAYRIENQHDQPLYIYVLDVSSDGSIGPLYPRGGQQELPAGGSFERRIRMSVPVGHTAVLDVIKVLATRQPIDPSIFPQGSIKGASEVRGRAVADPLSRLLSEAMRGKRAAEDVTVRPDSWATAQKAIRIRSATAARLTSFYLHFDRPGDARNLASQLSSTRTPCKSEADPAQDCDRLVPAAKDGTVFELVPAPVTRGPALDQIPVGQAFDEAYKLQDETGARRVEPMLEIQVPGAETAQGIDTRDVSGDDQHDPAAAADDQWSLRLTRAQESWAKIRARLNVPEGAEARGVSIAHPDTGYREHPENWQAVGGTRPIDVANGKIYMGDGPTALDPLLSDRLLDNPGHGTASGSVIVSPAGCQLSGASKCVNGIARGARLVPLRVHRSVSQFNTRNLSQAIQDVADGRIGGNPTLVSIAMGGPPTLMMWKAVTSAEQSGVLVVAAAGNYVKTVVWPARFKATIAAAAANVRCAPWKHSSHGSAVDISAPGESVWRATLNESHDYINAMGKGTTFATGHTAGAAALWLAYHRDDAEMADLRRQGLVTKAFRAALRASAWRPDGDPKAVPPGASCDTAPWSSDFGPGLLDVAQLLDGPLAVPRVLGQAPSEELLPLFASLYPEGSDPQEIRSAYLALFGQQRAADLEQLSQFETEIMHHYTVNEEVRRSVDALVSGQRGLAPAEAARRALSRQELSNRLRQAMGQ